MLPAILTAAIRVGHHRALIPTVAAPPIADHPVTAPLFHEQPLCLIAHVESDGESDRHEAMSRLGFLQVKECPLTRAEVISRDVRGMDFFTRPSVLHAAKMRLQDRDDGVFRLLCLMDGVVHPILRRRRHHNRRDCSSRMDDTPTAMRANLNSSGVEKGVPTMARASSSCSTAATALPS